ncbi:isopentenyldiphosphate isomerase [Natranaerovirga pectinivora]|uniref:Isopentenyldiphosphate isomerase n=1 Tax=Natranaerovirga pectinivora TaxID=682400 RepID=A0A4R3MRN3_9FIRM|nr:NUDIX domain-containing protein [Natranaerovirga pectinivora]TCT17173.1 isopentenyldiphosphate isomerase [Natranaerovirga pectinivora]
MELWDILDKDRNKTGKLIERGQHLKTGEYHLVVFAFIKNSKGELLISKRTPNKTYPNTWEITGGAAVTGDTSLTAIIREAKEELGINLEIDKGKIIKSFRCDVNHSYFADVWLFEQDINFDNIVCQPEEVSEAALVTKEELIALIKNNMFIQNDYVLECLELL